ncbi:hypothetical protein HanRHA438_Chr14g0651621 [Helianthus annuus]|nr:hypothetical protein HanRHA438_Chr14g0651621 [Helianthus annuus]
MVQIVSFEGSQCEFIRDFGTHIMRGCHLIMSDCWSILRLKLEDSQVSILKLNESQVTIPEDFI